MTLILPVPPSTNRLWRCQRGRMVKSREARHYALEVALLAHAARLPMIPADRPVAVTVRWFRARRAGDLDNRLKAVLDALQGIAFVNDAQVVALNFTRYDDPARPRVEVEVTEVLADE